MKYRTPILSLTVDPDGVLSRYDCGEVAGSVQQMVESMTNYWPRDTFGVEKGERGRRYVMAHHDLSSCVDELEALMERAASDQSSAA